MTPRETLTYFGELKGYPHSKIYQRVEEIVEMIDMSEWIDKKIGTFSKGMRQKIGVISAIVHDPDIIVLDEPHVGLDPSHLLYEVSEVADRVAMISNGEIIACDTLEKLESMAKKSEIQMELLEIPENGADDMVKRLDHIIGSHTGLENKPDYIRFNPDTEIFEILFNGDPKKQLEIFKALFSAGFSAGIDVIEFSVPKAGLLEDLYLKFMSESKENVAEALHKREVDPLQKGEITV